MRADQTTIFKHKNVEYHPSVRVDSWRHNGGAEQEVREPGKQIYCLRAGMFHHTRRLSRVQIIISSQMSQWQR